jgi:hypothetical protein
VCHERPVARGPRAAEPVGPPPPTDRAAPTIA